MLKYQGNQEKRCKSRSVNNVSCKVGVRRYTIWKDLKQKVEDQPQLCLYWCVTRAVRCTRCTWGGRGPCRCWRTERGGCCCWRWWERSHSRTTRSARTPSSSVRTSASWRSPTSTQHAVTTNPDQEITCRTANPLIVCSDVLHKCIKYSNCDKWRLVNNVAEMAHCNMKYLHTGVYLINDRHEWHGRAINKQERREFWSYEMNGKHQWVSCNFTSLFIERKYTHSELERTSRTKNVTWDEDGLLLTCLLRSSPIRLICIFLRPIFSVLRLTLICRTSSFFLFEVVDVWSKQPTSHRHLFF